MNAIYHNQVHTVKRVDTLHTGESYDDVYGFSSFAHDVSVFLCFLVTGTGSGLWLMKD